MVLTDIMDRQQLLATTSKQIDVGKTSETTAFDGAMQKHKQKQKQSQKQKQMKNKSKRKQNRSSPVDQDMQGQEMLWVEDAVEAPTSNSTNKKVGMFRSFRASSTNGGLTQTNTTPNTNTNTNTNNISSKIVLLEQDDEKTRFFKRTEASKKADYARRLLNTALTTSNETMLKSAFTAAAEARRLVETQPDEAQLQLSASQGEQCTRDAWNAKTEILYPPSQRSKKPLAAKQNKENTTKNDDLTVRAQERTFQDHAEEARRNLERMLPTFLINAVSSEDDDEGEPSENEQQYESREGESEDHSQSSVSVNTFRNEQIARVVKLQHPSLAAGTPYSPKMGLSTTISTLGFDNTFDDKTFTSPTKQAPGDDISVSSLNDFLDGQEDIKKTNKNKSKGVALPVVARKPKQNESMHKNPGIIARLKKKNSITEPATLEPQSTHVAPLVEMVNPQKTDAINPIVIDEQSIKTEAALTAKEVPSTSFIVAPDIPKGALTAKSWDALASGHPLEGIIGAHEKKAVPLKREPSIAKSLPKTRFPLFKKTWGSKKGGTKEEEVVELPMAPAGSANLSPEKITSEPKTGDLSTPPVPRAVVEKQVPVSTPSLTNIPFIGSEESQLQPEVGDKYTAVADETDEVTKGAKRRLDNKAPILSDVDLLLTSEPNVPSSIRNVVSMDTSDVNAIENVAWFGQVEVGGDEEHIQVTLLNRESVIKAMNTPRSAVQVVGGAPPMKRTSTSSTGVVLSSVTFLEELATNKPEETKLEPVELVEPVVEKEEVRVPFFQRLRQRASNHGKPRQPISSPFFRKRDTESNTRLLL